MSRRTETQPCETEYSINLSIILLAPLLPANRDKTRSVNPIVVSQLSHLFPHEISPLVSRSVVWDMAKVNKAFECSQDGGAGQGKHFHV